ncbi:hypothetical protein OVA24_10090 [Luteolibacter sp. SL250]|uniref:hypothetical protein n=1 Tax=Luteolibacter sp. SL250 TaxID=2995170 RepID=UPI00227189D7|nr:hypothetical protein [Luteolibacter sp. SL250]WAC21734.1 hypothetical protein OVA24_10090 [Luteolibacter sp. SL250]
MAGLSDGFGVNRHPLARPLKRAAIIGLLAVLGLFAHITYTIHQVSSTVDPIDKRLKQLSSQSKGEPQRGASGASWSTTYRFPEERMNRESHDIIRDALKSHGWDMLEEFTAILPDNLMGGYLIRAEKWGYTYVAHLPKSGADLRIEVAESGEPQVSRPAEEMEITGR